MCLQKKEHPEISLGNIYFTSTLPLQVHHYLWEEIPSFFFLLSPFSPLFPSPLLSFPFLSLSLCLYFSFYTSFLSHSLTHGQPRGSVSYGYALYKFSALHVAILLFLVRHLLWKLPIQTWPQKTSSLVRPFLPGFPVGGSVFISNVYWHFYRLIAFPRAT